MSIKYLIMLIGKDVQGQYRNTIRHKMHICPIFLEITQTEKDFEQVNFIVNLREKHESPTSYVHSPDKIGRNMRGI